MLTAHLNQEAERDAWPTTERPALGQGPWEEGSEAGLLEQRHWGTSGAQWAGALPTQDWSLVGVGRRGGWEGPEEPAAHGGTYPR